MPIPKKDETEEEFVKRCIPIIIDEGVAKDGKQAVAICHAIFKKVKKNAK